MQLASATAVSRNLHVVSVFIDSFFLVLISPCAHVRTTVVADEVRKNRLGLLTVRS